ncbi:MAG: ATP-binding protein, partial [Myxococcota bacterium]|nr:ATP-binding protein [Myxococcota bacterium]
GGGGGAGIAHDFNTLVVSIRGGGAGAPLQLPRGRSAVSQLSAVELAAERAVRLTRSMTSLTDSREQPRSPTPLAPVLRELVDSMVDGLPDRVTLKLEAPVPDVCLAADRVELEQIIFNLVSNANEAMLDAGTIDLGISIPDEEPRMLRLDVRDTGAGMGPDVLARMFEPFYTTRAEVGGHGLGLTSVQSLVDRLGGRISAASEVGVGSCLSVWLPLSPGDGGARPSGGGADVAKASEVKQGALEGLSVLVVDDEAEVRDVVTALLESLGARVEGVGSGPEALESLAGSQPYSLLVTDVRMPGMDGHALLRAARAAGHGLPAILSSGFDPADPEDADELRPFRRLAKPFRRDQLLQCIQGLQELAPAG